QVPVCRSDKRRLDGGEDPEIRLVRAGDRYVPWYEAERERGLLLATIGSPSRVGRASRGDARGGPRPPVVSRPGKVSRSVQNPEQLACSLACAITPVGGARAATFAAEADGGTQLSPSR
ncbi:MAG: hypothetical protein ACRDOX_06350, partial [Nocardioides sp.]